MPIDSLRSVADQFDHLLRSVHPKLIASEITKVDRAFYFRHFKGVRPEKIGRNRLRKIADREIFKDPGHELFANLLILHWNQGQGPLYREMVTHVQAINEDVEAIEVIEDDVANKIIDDLLERHHRTDILLCVRLNGVRFQEEVIQARLVQSDGGDAASSTPPEGGPQEVDG